MIARTESLWRHGDFRKLWVAQTISVFGTGFTQLALPMIAVTLLAATPAQMGFLGMAQYLPFLLIGLVAGVWVDRWPRRPDAGHTMPRTWQWEPSAGAPGHEVPGITRSYSRSADRVG